MAKNTVRNTARLGIGMYGSYGYISNPYLTFPFPVIDGREEDDAWYSGTEVIDLVVVDIRTIMHPPSPDRGIGEYSSSTVVGTPPLRRVARILAARAAGLSEEEVERKFYQLLEEVTTAAVRCARAFPDETAGEFGEVGVSEAAERMRKVWCAFEDATGVRLMAREEAR